MQSIAADPLKESYSIENWGVVGESVFIVGICDQLTRCGRTIYMFEAYRIDVAK